MGKRAVRQRLPRERGAAPGAPFGVDDLPRLDFALGRDVARHLLTHGYAVMNDVWSQAQAGLLAKEAAALLFGRPERCGAGPPQQATASDAPVLASLQFALLPTVRAMTGQLLVPSYGWYNFYSTDDGIWLHIDIEDSDLAILSTAFGETGPLHIHPYLSGLEIGRAHV